MTTLMFHPEGGRTYAYGEVDIQWHQKHGWKIVEPVKIEEPAGQMRPIPADSFSVKRKPGRPRKNP